MPLDLPAPIAELGEVLVEWGEHRHVIKMPIRQANELDEALLKEDPNGDGLRGFIAGSYTRHTPQYCFAILTQVFAASGVTVSNADLEELEDEYGVLGLKDLVVSLAANAVAGKKRLREARAEAEALKKIALEKMQQQPTASSGDATTAPQ